MTRNRLPSTPPPSATSRSRSTSSSSGDAAQGAAGRVTTGDAAPGEAGEVTTLDLRGEVCPYTFVRTRLALEALPLGAVLEVVVDHEPATRNVPRSAREWGQDVKSVESTNDGWRIAIVKHVP